MNFKINVGAQTEDEVQAAVESAFSPDFVFRSPRREGGKEVTDVLVLFDDVALIIQAKAQALELRSEASHGNTDWAAKNLKKAGQQVNGAIRALRAGRMPFVENSRRGRVPFRVHDYPHLYGLIVLEHESDPYDPMKLVPSLREIQAPVTVLSFRDFWNLNEFLDTPNDLINYLEHRPEVLVPTLHPKVHEEAQVFGYFIERLEDVMEVQARFTGRALPDGVNTYARELRRVVNGEHPNKQAGLVIDHIIDKIHDADPDVTFTDAAGEPVGQEAYFRLVTELSMIPRSRRIALGERYQTVVDRAGASNENSHDATHSPSRGDCIVLLASPFERSERLKRTKHLMNLTKAAQSYFGVSRAIGIATEAGHDHGCSYDVVLLESEPVDDRELKELGRRLFGDVTQRLFAAETST